MTDFSLGHLSDTDFEQYCYDLLDASGFSNLNCRKGTGKASSPSDQGRDIEGDFERVDVDGRKFTERWFVDCKQYKEGVPPTAIQGALSWANAERPNVLLIVASNFLSNPNKEYIESYKVNNRPSFRIVFWEKPDLEKMTITKSRLMLKYKIGDDLPFKSLLHPAHLLYVSRAQANTLSYFLSILDDLDHDKRQRIFYFPFVNIIRPKLEMPASLDDTFGDLFSPRVSYKEFKNACNKVIASGLFDDSTLVTAVVINALQICFMAGDRSRNDIVKRNNLSALSDYRGKLEKTDDIQEKHEYQQMIEKAENALPILKQIQ